MPAASTLEAHIREFSAATGKPVAQVAREALKSLVKYALQNTPPASAGVQGKAAQRAGENAVLRDLGRMGFTPVPIKGFRVITQVYGRPLQSPIRVPTQLNPKFEDPEGFHRQRLIAAGHRRGAVSRGGTQAFYVDQNKFTPLRKKLLAKVGALSSGWAAAAKELGVPVPAWLARHAGLGRGTTVQTSIDGPRITVKVINHFPIGAEDTAAETERRIALFKTYVANNFARQLKAFYAGKWSQTKKG